MKRFDSSLYYVTSIFYEFGKLENQKYNQFFVMLFWHQNDVYTNFFRQEKIFFSTFQTFLIMIKKNLGLLSPDTFTTTSAL